MGVEPNSDRIWNAIGGVAVAGLIIAGMVFTANGSLSTISDNFLGFLDKGFTVRMPGEKPDYTADEIQLRTLSQDFRNKVPFDSRVSGNKVVNIVFKSVNAPSGVTVTNLGLDDKSLVKGWIDPNDETTFIISAGDDEWVFAPEDSGNLFYGYNGRLSKVASLNLGNTFDTSNVRSMSEMFRYMELLKTLNLGDNFDTSNVTSMRLMFNGMRLLTKLDLGDKFDTSIVNNMDAMFDGMKSLTTLNLGDKFDTSKVVDMDSMFRNMRALTTLNLGDKFDTSRVAYMSFMFYYTESLTTLNLGDKFNTSKVRNMSWMFYYMGLRRIYSNDFDTSSVTESTGMFSGNTGLITSDGVTLFKDAGLAIDHTAAHTGKDGKLGAFTPLSNRP